MIYLRLFWEFFKTGLFAVGEPIGFVHVFVRDHLNGKQLTVANEIAVRELALVNETK